MADLDPLPDELRALLDAERRRGEAPDAARDRVLLRLGATVGLALPLGHAAGVASHAGKGAALGPLARLGHAGNLARAAAIFAAGAASGAGGYRAVEHARAKAARQTRQVARAPQRELPAAPAPLPEIIPAPPSPAPPPSAREAPAARPHKTAVATPPAAPAAPAVQGDDRLAAERALLEIAREALVRGQADGALAALTRHEATFPGGELAEEREGLFVQALVAAHRYDQARARAVRFDQRYPRSLFAPVVTQALRSIP